MPVIRIVPNVEESPLVELRGKKIEEVGPADQIWTALPAGMASGKASVAVVVKLADGSYVYAQQSMALFVGVCVAFAAKYPDEWRALGVTLEVTAHPKGRE